MDLLLRGMRSTWVILELRLRGTRNTLTLWGLPARAWTPLGPSCLHVGSTALCAHGLTFVWQVHLSARGWTPLGPGCFGVAGAALRAHGLTFAWHAQHLGASGPRFAWQAQHFDSLGIAGARLDAAGPGCFRVAGAALCAHGLTFVWQVHHFDSLGIAGARLDAALAWHHVFGNYFHLTRSRGLLLDKGCLDCW